MPHQLKKRIAYSYAFITRRLSHLNLQLLYQCNFKCDICDFWKPPYNTMPMMSLEQVKTVSRKLKELNPFVISVGGGEPLLHPDIIPICRELSENNLPVMISNGWFIDRNTARELWKSGLFEISVSLDYASAAKHDAHRGREGAFERAVSALEALAQTRVHRYQRVHMISTIKEDNLEETEALIKLCREIGVTFLVSCYSSGRGTAGKTGQVKDYSGVLLGLKKQYPEFLSLRGYIGRFSDAMLNPDGVSRCMAGKNLFNIDCQGDVTLCIDRLDGKAGNIFRDEPNALRQNLLTMHRENPCRKCWSSCRGSVETLLYQSGKLRNYYDFYRLTKNQPLFCGKN